MTLTEAVSTALAAIHRPRLHLTRVQQQALLLALLMAVLWWLVALWIRSTGKAHVWYDQEHVFLPSARNLADPFQVAGFINPPWAAVALLPFAALPLPLAVLTQLFLLFATVALTTLRFGGSLRSVVIALVSYMAFDNALEVNIDWLSYLGLLVPVAWSGPLLFSKPQNALGYYAGFRWQIWGKAAAISIIWFLLSLLLWGWWPERMLHAIQTNLVGQSTNLAPLILLPAPVSIAIGLVLAAQAYRRRDPLLGIFAWLFFVPYLKFYSLLLHLALASARWPRMALLISGVMWIVYGSLVGRYLLGF
ncbi:MAG: hypothetical protein DIU68_002085 [Chloroflexota bacterium]|nr:MAG: hypothetical protein DIU68_12675 [Chloroflexota bacterium]